MFFLVFKYRLAYLINMASVDDLATPGARESAYIVVI